MTEQPAATNDGWEGCTWMRPDQQDLQYDTHSSVDGERRTDGASPTHKDEPSWLKASKFPKAPLPNLQNHGNTCYMNAVMQALLGTPPFASYFRNHQPARLPSLQEQEDSSPLSLLAKAVKNLLNSKKKKDDELKPFVDVFWKEHENSQFSRRRQADAHEFW